VCQTVQYFYNSMMLEECKEAQMRVICLAAENSPGANEAAMKEVNTWTNRKEGSTTGVVLLS
jgi:hypothetical protein